jgi:hypothetical protein
MLFRMLVWVCSALRGEENKLCKTAFCTLIFVHDFMYRWDLGKMTECFVILHFISVDFPSWKSRTFQHPSFWANLSWASQRPLSTWTVPRFVSQSKIKRRSSLSRTASYNLLHIHKRHTCPKRQQWPRRRTTGEEERTRLASHQERQSIWSTHSDLSMTIFLLHHSLLRRMILAYWWPSVPSDKESSIKPSATLGRVST